MSARDQSDLIARIRRGDSQAMGTLYDLYGKLAYTLILRIVGEASTAEDVLAETFVKVWNQIGSVKDARGDGLGLWILSLARYQSIEYLRSNTGEAPRTNALEQPALFRALPQHSLRARATAQLQNLRTGLSTLPAEEREVLELAFFTGFSSNEIAQKLGQPVGEVKKSISAALAKLASHSTSMQSP